LLHGLAPFQVGIHDGLPLALIKSTFSHVFFFNVYSGVSDPLIPEYLTPMWISTASVGR